MGTLSYRNTGGTLTNTSLTGVARYNGGTALPFGGSITAPTFIAEYETAFNTSTSPKTQASVTLQVNDLVVLTLLDDPQFGTTETYPTPATFTGAVKMDKTTSGWQSFGGVSGANVGHGALFACYASVAGTYTISVTYATAASEGRNWGFDVAVWRGSGGIGANRIDTSLTLGGTWGQSVTTTQVHSALMGYAVDWNGATISGRTWNNLGGTTPTAANGHELVAFLASGSCTFFGAKWPDLATIGSYTVGMSFPAMAWGGIAFEVKGQ